MATASMPEEEIGDSRPVVAPSRPELSPLEKLTPEMFVEALKRRALRVYPNLSPEDIAAGEPHLSRKLLEGRGPCLDHVEGREPDFNPS